jgi:predicted Zn finger-like uncharacterized protein
MHIPPMTNIMLRACPNCDARYKVVRVESGPTDKFCEITCKSCGGRLEGRDGTSILKYFLVS